MLGDFQSLFTLKMQVHPIPPPSPRVLGGCRTRGSGGRCQDPQSTDRVSPIRNILPSAAAPRHDQAGQTMGKPCFVGPSRGGHGQAPCNKQVRKGTPRAQKLADASHTRLQVHNVPCSRNCLPSDVPLSGPRSQPFLPPGSSIYGIRNQTSQPSCTPRLCPSPSRRQNPRYPSPATFTDLSAGRLMVGLRGRFPASEPLRPPSQGRRPSVSLETPLICTACGRRAGLENAEGESCWKRGALQRMAHDVAAPPRTDPPGAMLSKFSHGSRPSEFKRKRPFATVMAELAEPDPFAFVDWDRVTEGTLDTRISGRFSSHVCVEKADGVLPRGGNGASLSGAAIGRASSVPDCQGQEAGWSLLLDRLFRLDALHNKRLVVEAAAAEQHVRDPEECADGGERGIGTGIGATETHHHAQHRHDKLGTRCL